MEIKLEQLDEFKKVLEHYSLNLVAKAVLAATPLVLLVGPTSSGRDTIINELVKTGHYYPIITDTTRPPRINNGVLEQDGINYFFRTERAMLDDLRNGQFIEAAIIHNQQVSGVSVREIEKAKTEGKIAITDIEPVGADNIVRTKPNTVAIFLLPPNFEEWLNRLKKRNPHMTSNELKRRLTSAAKEFRMALEHDYYVLIINDNLQQATDQVDRLVRNNNGQAITGQLNARKLLETLLADTEAYLITRVYS